MTIAAVALLIFLSPGCATETAGPTPTQPATTSVSGAAIGTASTTTLADTTTSAESSGLATYVDRRDRFTIQYPAQWKDTPLPLLGDTDTYGIEAVGFADQGGPTNEDYCYLDFMQVNILEDGVIHEAVLSQLKDVLPKTLERLRKKADEVTVLETWQETQIAGAPGMILKLSVSIDGQEFVGMDCVLVANQRFYEIEFMTVEEDWGDYEPLFREILKSFKTDAP